MMKKYQSCILCLLTGILVAGILLSACFRAVPDAAEDMAKKGLPAYLVTAMPENPYACAEISIEDVTAELGGKVNVSWKTFVTAQELQEYIAGKEKRDTATRNHVADGRSVYIAHPKIVSFQSTESNDISLAPRVESIIEVYSHPVVNKMGENALTYDWENFVREVTRCSELCDGRIYNLNFERYHVEGGSDLYGYTFEFDAYDRLYEIAVFIRLEKVNMLETIGVRLKVDNDVLKDVTRYIGASFVDYGGELHSGYRRMKDNVGADEWDYPELHNMFSWAMAEECIYAGRPAPDFPDDCPVTFEEPRIERAVRDALAELWQLDDEQRSAFEDRPLMRSDLLFFCRQADIAARTDHLCMA